MQEKRRRDSKQGITVQEKAWTQLQNLEFVYKAKYRSDIV